jgi:hypothetical protein
MKDLVPDVVKVLAQVLSEKVCGVGEGVLPSESHPREFV